MGVTTPDKFTKLAELDYAPTEEALAPEWLDLAHNGHFLWSVQVAHMGGHAWDPPFDVADISYTQEANTAGRRPLDELELTSRLRKVDDQDRVWWHVEAHIEQVDLQATLVRRESDGSLAVIDQATVSETTGTPTWKSIDRSVSATSVRESGVSTNDFAPVFMSLEAKVQTDGDLGKIRHLDAWEAIASPLAHIP